MHRTVHETVQTNRTMRVCTQGAYRDAHPSVPPSGTGSLWP